MASDNGNDRPDAGQIAAISDSLVQARRAAIALPGFPGAVPENFDDAYAVQHRSRAAWADTVGGWKVGGMPPHLRPIHKTNWLTGPIYNSSIVHAKDAETNGDGQIEMPGIPGFVAVEAEFVFEMGETPEQDRLFIGIEIASSPLPAINDIGPAAVICDFGNNNGLLVGPEITDWRTREWPEFNVETDINGELIGSLPLNNVADAALGACAFLREHAKKHGIDLPAGTFISSGALTGVHETHIGASSVVRFGPFGQMQIKLVAAKPVNA